MDIIRAVEGAVLLALSEVPDTEINKALCLKLPLRTVKFDHN